MVYRYQPQQSQHVTTSTFPTLVCSEEECHVVYESSSSSEEVSTGYEVFQSNSAQGNRKDPTPYYFEKTKVEANQGSSTFVTESGLGTTTTVKSGRGVNSAPAPFSHEPDVSYEVAYNKAASSFLEKVRGGIDLSVDIAQGGQVVRMLRDARKLEVYLFRELANPKDWARRWLELQYGWKPLANTLYESATVLVKRPYDRLCTVEGRGTDFDAVSPTGLYHSGQKSRSQRILMKAQYVPPDSTSSEISRWTSLNPLSIAWELTPYSFVVDWFYDVGGYIRDLETAYLFRSAFRKGFITSTWQQREFTSYFERASGTGYSIAKNGNYKEVTSILSRSKMQTAPFPYAPRIQANLGSSRLLSAASLLTLKLPKGIVFGK